MMKLTNGYMQACMLMMLGRRIVMMEGITSCCVWRKASPTPKRPWRRIPPIRARSSFVFVFSIRSDAVHFQIPSFVPCCSCFVLLCALSVSAIRWVRVCSRYELLILDDRVRRLENRTFRVLNSSEDRLHAWTEIRNIVGCRPLSFSSIACLSKSPS
jgi:hypothetical protein